MDGPEIDPAAPPALPLAGRASYAGPAGGLYVYAAGSAWGDATGTRLVDEYEGRATLVADFATRSLSGCIGCEGDLVTRRAHFGIFLGNELRDPRAVAADYELHFGAAPLRPDGTFEHGDVTVLHPERTVTASEGSWGGTLSNIPDSDGNPRLAAGFSGAEFEESDGSSGCFFGTFVALSEDFAASHSGGCAISGGRSGPPPSRCGCARVVPAFVPPAGTSLQGDSTKAGGPARARSRLSRSGKSRPSPPPRLRGAWPISRRNRSRLSHSTGSSSRSFLGEVPCLLVHHARSMARLDSGLHAPDR